ncbi:MAG: undecaprenyl-diphosphate phosphatase [Treponema sp.]|jgi:undecaprenyl-diphosphatase|nr:undecaprenyl-diphosphate phosphatase [Treponema sp.]
MKIFEAILLGAIQGVTEFLPVSSSGHLVLVQRIFGISEPALFFDTMVHVGTLAAVFVVLWKDIWGILRRPVQPVTGFLILATLPTVAAALVFKDGIERAFASGSLLGFAFLFTAAALLVSWRLSGRPCPEGRSGKAAGAAGKAGILPEGAMGWLDALVIGLCQAVAVVPGVSRSGMTLSGALARKLDRDVAARFSFLLSIPAILGALVLQLKDLAGGAGTVPETGGIGPGAVAAGTVTAAIVGFFAVKFMLKIVREKSLWGFAVYTAVLGALVLADQAATHFFF